MSPQKLLTLWRKECGRASALVDLSKGKDAAGNFKSKGLRFDEKALMKIGGAIEALASQPSQLARDFHSGGGLTQCDMHEDESY